MGNCADFLENWHIRGEYLSLIFNVTKFGIAVDGKEGKKMFFDGTAQVDLKPSEVHKLRKVLDMWEKEAH